jgi:hypothetical protein
MNAVENYLKELGEARLAGVPETSGYAALAKLLDEVGKTLKPKVRCIINPKNQGAGIPDGGLFTADLFKRNPADDLLRTVLPDRGAIEVKAPTDDAWVVADGTQVARYWQRYGHVLVTNYRDFVMVGRDAQGKPVKLETYRLAGDDKAFWAAAAQPRKTAELQGERFTEYLKRVMLHAAPIGAPADVAWFLASYARDARIRIEQQPDLPALAAVRKALEEALGMSFTGEKGEHFFRSTLVQTLFYGVFSAWVLWHKEDPARRGRFEPALAAKYLRVPVLRKLFWQITEPGQLDELNLAEVLDWAVAVLNRVDRASFFAAFTTGHEIQYFYEPFLEAFDPELRAALGVWYTPIEIVQYQVARVDAVLKEELGIADGLADPRVYILDPVCGTGAYLVETLRHIAAALKDKHGDALFAAEVKRAATERVFGFEILPAPFVVAHLQLGLLLQNLGAPLGNKKTDRVAVYLTNALTGWEPPKEPKQHLMFQEFEEERDAANHVKQSERILVVIGNPPYNGFAGVAVKEERDLSEAYRQVKQVAKPQGQGLNDLYIRFFRMAERRIVEKNQPAQGVICFISNYSWLDGLSHTGMRERYLEAFDNIWIDCLNGDKYKTGKLTPDGQPDPSVFSTETNREGIQVGTAITTLVRKADHQPTSTVQFRHLWGKNKRAQLLAEAQQLGAPSKQVREKPSTPGKNIVTPVPGMGLSFMPGQVAAGYLTWPLLPELFPVNFPGIQASRDDVVVDIDRDRLVERMKEYFDPEISHEEMRRKLPRALESTARFDAEPTREYLTKRGFLTQYVIRHIYRPFDVRWLYWEPETKLLDEKRSEYFPHVVTGNIWLASAQRHRKDFDPPEFATVHCARHVDERGANLFPLYLHTTAQAETLLDKAGTKPNLSDAGAAYLAKLKAMPEELFYHTLAVLHAPGYRQENGGALRQDWPRVPLPDRKAKLAASAELGRAIAALLDTGRGAPGVTEGKIRPELKEIAVFTLPKGKALDEETDFAVTAGWGHAGKDGVTMPGKGTIIEQGNALDIYLNESAYWRNVPVAVWEYTLGGYQVIKKWLSYREKELLGRSLTLDEIKEVTNMARRIAALLALQAKLDDNYEAVKANTHNLA